MQAHAVIFDLPAALRASQVMRRDSGKGCVEGLGARRVVRMTCTMIRELRTTPPYRIENYPSLSEGLQSIIVSHPAGHSTSLGLSFLSFVLQ
jgi:hypothetical protein